MSIPERNRACYSPNPMVVSETQPTRARSGLSGVVLVALAAVLVGTLYAWCLTTDPLAKQGYPFRWRYYPLQVEGWLQGRLDLPMPVPPGLVALPDPHDPKANATYRFGENGLHDLTLFNGRLYMYWGPTPALIAFLPWRLLTHTALPTPWAAWLFVFGGWLASATLLVRLARRCFPDVGTTAMFGTLLALAVCNWGVVVLRRGDVYETAIAAGYFFVAAAWCCLAECLWADGPRRAARLTAAGVAFGFAIGARPNLVVGAGVLLIPLLTGRRQGHRWTHAAGALLQVAAAGTTLMLLNYLRFENPFDFGQHNQLAGVPLDHAALFSPTYALFNARTYLFSLPRWGEFFPFIFPPANHVLPMGYMGTEGAYGLFTSLPFLTLGAAVWFGRVERRVIALAAMLLVSFVSAFVVLLGFLGAATRYELELAPALALLAAIGVLAWEQRVATERRPRRVGRAVWGAALLVSVATAMCASWRYDTLFAITEPATYTRLARATNLAAVKLGLTPANALRAIELEVKFPAHPTPDHGPEVLLSTGADGNHDAIVVDYPTPDTLRIGLAHATQKKFLPPVAIDRNTTHRVHIELGSFLPPITHPFWRTMDATVAARMCQLVAISLDERPLFLGNAHLFEPMFARPVIGRLFDPLAALPPFSGTISLRQEVWISPPEPTQSAPSVP